MEKDNAEKTEELLPDEGETGSKGEGSETQTKNDEYEKLVHELADYKDKYIRLFAEFENARKRMDREKAEFIKYANEGIIIEFLGILDDLERVKEIANKNHQKDPAFIKGVEMVANHIGDVFKRNGVVPIEAKGKQFDPHCQEVLMQEESDSPDGLVLEEFQKGYYLGDRVVRTAKVKVAKAKASGG